jgi:hypothetical protein
MQAEAMAILLEVGAQLDHDRYPRIHDGGIVQPGDVTVSCSTRGEEKNHVASRQRRSATGPWQRPPGRQRQAYRPRPTGGATPVVCSGLQKRYEAELNAVQEVYPDTKCWRQFEEMWLLTESTLLHGLGKKATFLTMIPYIKKFPIKSWGFWTTPIYIEWIGPRHTNFPDGSICAFEPRDKTWVSGDSIIKLLDLYSLWAFRHLYLEIFGRWPGYQSVPHPYERLRELRDDEYCGCAHSDRMYADCCKKHDLARDRTADALDFLLNFTNRGLRTPPKEFLKFIRHREKPPPIINFLSQACL